MNRAWNLAPVLQTVQMIAKNYCQKIFLKSYRFVAEATFKAPLLGFTLFLLYIIDLADDVFCNIGIYADDTTTYSNSLVHL